MITDEPGEKQAHDPDVVVTAVVPPGTTLVASGPSIGKSWTAAASVFPGNAI